MIRLPQRALCSTSRSSNSRSISMAVRANGTRKDVWALDFDGVLCDSVGESSLSAWKAAEKLWPEIFTKPEALQRKPELLEKMRVVRPVVETGYENVVQIRALYDGVSVDDMLARWHSDMLPSLMARLGCQRSDLVALFGGVRDDWIRTDLAGWLAPNRFYEGTVGPVRAALASPAAEVFIVTTKQARFTEQLLKEMAGVDFPPDRIYSQTESGEPKSKRLEDIEAMHPGNRYHFVEDKLSTLDKVCQAPSLAHWNLYLVDWGYNTAEERARAAGNPRIQVIDAGQFGKLLRDGEL